MLLNIFIPKHYEIKISFLACILTVFAFAQSAPSYYSGINFSKTKNDLKSDLATLITNTTPRIFLILQD